MGILSPTEVPGMSSVDEIEERFAGWKAGEVVVEGDEEERGCEGVGLGDDRSMKRS